MAETTYLELSEEQGVSHKFYEVTVDGCDLTIRYGRIGTNGTRQQKTFPTAEKAQAEATKKLGAKRRKGYEDAVMGQRKKRAITRRQIQSTRSTAKGAPVLWKSDTGRSAFGIFIDDQACWVGNEEGRIFALDHEGQPNYATLHHATPVTKGFKAVITKWFRSSTRSPVCWKWSHTEV